MTHRRALQLLQRAFPKAKHLLRKDWLLTNLASGIDSTGFCYIATEALFHMIGGVSSGFRPMCAVYDEGTHWWLDREGCRLDPTASQYESDVPPYDLGRCMGFQNGYNKPSKRAAALIAICLGRNAHDQNSGSGSTQRGMGHNQRVSTVVKARRAKVFMVEI